MIIQPARQLINIYANDPEANGMHLVQVTAPIGRCPFDIPGWAGSAGLHSPGSREFQGAQLFVILNRAYGLWSGFFGSPIEWPNGAECLRVEPRAGEDLNAYYDRKSLRFFYHTHQETGKTLFACESADIAAHECGHAVLDAIHPEYWDSLLPETAAFHEAFGDISAILTTLADEGVRRAVLEENDGDLRKSNAVTRLAEQMAGGMWADGLKESVAGPKALRDVATRFRYSPPESLPWRAPATRLSSESHSFSRIFSGAFYDILVTIYEAVRKARPTLDPGAALELARLDSGRLLAHALSHAPRGEAPFKTMAVSLLVADAQSFAGRYSLLLRQVLVNRRLLKAREAGRLQEAGGTAAVVTGTRTGAAALALGTSRRPQINDAESDVGTLVNLRTALGLDPEEYHLASENQSRGLGRVLHYTAPQTVQFTGQDLGDAHGVQVALKRSVAVRLDAGNRVMSTLEHLPGEGEKHQVREHIVRLAQRGRIYLSRAAEEIDLATLLEQRKPYYISYDNAGGKRIRRAFIACS